MKRGRKPGTPKTGGRQPGATNKITKALKDMILGALDDAGGQTYLSEQAVANPTAFLSLLGKVLPSEITGQNNGPMQLVINLKRWDSGKKCWE